MKRLLLTVSLATPLLGGCATLASSSAGHIEFLAAGGAMQHCEQDEITIANERKGPVTTTWEATCKGHTFVCTAQSPQTGQDLDLSNVECVAKPSVASDPWPDRVGHWTINDAISTLGRPGDIIPLDNGSHVYEWRESKHEQVVTAASKGEASARAGGLLGTGYGGGGAHADSQSSGYQTGEVTHTMVTRCTFDAKGILVRGLTIDQ